MTLLLFALLLTTGAVSIVGCVVFVFVLRLVLTLRLTLALVFLAPTVVELLDRNNLPGDFETGVFDSCASWRVVAKFEEDGARNAVVAVRIAVIQTRRVEFGFDIRFISLSEM